MHKNRFHLYCYFLLSFFLFLSDLSYITKSNDLNAEISSFEKKSFDEMKQFNFNFLAPSIKNKVLLKIKLFEDDFNFNVKNKIIKNKKFNRLYNLFNQDKTEVNYNNLVEFINYKLDGIVLQASFKKQTQLAELIIYDNKRNILYNSYYKSTNYNNYNNYKNKSIINNTSNKWVSGKNFKKNASLIAKSYFKSIKHPNEITTLDTATLQEQSLFKQTCYIGWYFDYNTFDSFIDTAKSNGITHIILEFILLILNNNGTPDQITFADTAQSWMNLSSDQRTTLLNKIRNNGMQLMVSFGGATSFMPGFQDVLNSPNYWDPQVLGNDLANWMFTYNCPAIDLDIEHIPTIGTYSDTLNLVTYLGELSETIKNKSNELFGYYPILSHAPQTPYFNGTSTYSNYGYIYNQVEKLYGQYIDFYNIQFYNQGNYAYTTYDGIFIQDDSFNASVLQLIEASSISALYTPIPTNKIVVGKPSNENEVSIENGFVYLYSTDPTYPQTMAQYVNSTETDARLGDWYTVGGNMIWIYLTGQQDNYYPNNQLLSYFNSTKH